MNKNDNDKEKQPEIKSNTTKTPKENTPVPPKFPDIYSLGSNIPNIFG